MSVKRKSSYVKTGRSPGNRGNGSSDYLGICVVCFKECCNCKVCLTEKQFFNICFKCHNKNDIISRSSRAEPIQKTLMRRWRQKQLKIGRKNNGKNQIRLSDGKFSVAKDDIR